MVKTLINAQKASFSSKNDENHEIRKIMEFHENLPSTPLSSARTPKKFRRKKKLKELCAEDLFYMIA